MASDQEIDRAIDRAVERASRAFESRTPTVDQIEKLVDKAVDEAVSKAMGPIVTRAVADTLGIFGIDANNKTDFMRDLIFLRDMRTLSSDSKKHVVLAVLAALTTAVLGGFFIYARAGGKIP